jgi:SAM-dependent methyltransferase
MGEFSADWLRLRTPADIRARAADLPRVLRAHLPKHASLKVLDLGCGTGSNLRALAPSLGGSQEWLCLDADQNLLDLVEAEIGTWAVQAGYVWDSRDRSLTGVDGDLKCAIETCRFNLAQSLVDLPLEDIGLLTASALLDLVSDDWLSELTARCAQTGVPMLFALTYDGRVSFDPELSFDPEVIEFVNTHQRRDKGFGPALGPAANGRLATLAASHGYWVEMRPSDWRIGTSERALQTALIEGWCEAACEQTPEAIEAIRHWRKARLEIVSRGVSEIQVGHRDLLALPSGLRRG